MCSLVFRTLQLAVFQLVICAADRITKLPLNTTPPEMMRILRENMALKAQVRALLLELKSEKGNHPRVSLATRALDGTTPADCARSSPTAELLTPADIKQRVLIEHSFAHGLLNAYELVEQQPESSSTAA